MRRSSVCRSQNKPRKFSKPGSQILSTIEQLLDELSGDASGIVQCNLGLFDSFRLLSIKNGCGGLPRTTSGVTCFCFDLVMMPLLLQERVMSVFGRIYLKCTDLDENEIFIRKWKTCQFWKWPLSKHLRIALTDLSKTVALFNEMIQNWLLRNMV